MENPIKMDDLGVPLFLETPIYKVHLYKSQVECFTPFTYLFSAIYRGELTLLITLVGAQLVYMVQTLCWIKFQVGVLIVRNKRYRTFREIFVFVHTFVFLIRGGESRNKHKR